MAIQDTGFINIVFNNVSVDKKSGTGRVKVSSRAPEVRGLSAAASLDVIDSCFVRCDRHELRVHQC